jgi:hypothetical protein
LRVLLAPCGFKESLTATELLDCMAEGVLTAAPFAEILRAPMVDGGEGFTRTLVAITSGELVPVTVTGPMAMSPPVARAPPTPNSPDVAPSRSWYGGQRPAHGDNRRPRVSAIDQCSIRC